ncbi:MAG TPA: hypothetical protein VJ742_00745 [Nitrososphaera sp.]|nr:hypothetical protein [Nitrososphaera sp.]
MKHFYYITGNTYPHRERLKQLGCRWDALAKSWYSENEGTASLARKLIETKNLHPSMKNLSGVKRTQRRTGQTRSGRMG